MAAVMNEVWQVLRQLATEIAGHATWDKIVAKGAQGIDEAQQKIAEQLSEAGPWLTIEMPRLLVHDRRGQARIDPNLPTLLQPGDATRRATFEEINWMRDALQMECGDPWDGGFQKHTGEEILCADIVGLRGARTAQVHESLLEHLGGVGIRSDERLTDARRAFDEAATTRRDAHSAREEARIAHESALAALAGAKRRYNLAWEESEGPRTRVLSRAQQEADATGAKLHRAKLELDEARRRLNAAAARVRSESDKTLNVYTEIRRIHENPTQFGDERARDLLRVFYRAVLCDRLATDENGNPKPTVGKDSIHVLRFYQLLDAETPWLKVSRLLSRISELGIDDIRPYMKKGWELVGTGYAVAAPAVARGAESFVGWLESLPAPGDDPNWRGPTPQPPPPKRGLVKRLLLLD